MYYPHEMLLFNLFLLESSRTLYNFYSVLQKRQTGTLQNRQPVLSCRFCSPQQPMYPSHAERYRSMSHCISFTASTVQRAEEKGKINKNICTIPSKRLLLGPLHISNEKSRRSAGNRTNRRWSNLAVQFNAPVHERTNRPLIYHGGRKDGREKR